MNKMMTAGLAALMIGGVAQAQDAAQNDGPTVSAEVALASAYVWRGQVLNDGFVLQPQLSIGQNGFTFNVWGNYDLEQNNAGMKNDLSEFDLSLVYTLPLNTEAITFDVGLIAYHFPADENGNTAGASTHELFLSATMENLPIVIPAFTIFGDFDQAEGVYALLSATVPFEISEAFVVEAGGSMGWGSTSYNSYYWESGLPGDSQDAGMNDYNLFVSAGYEITESVAMNASLAYTVIDGARKGSVYQSNEQIYAAVGVSYEF